MHTVFKVNRKGVKNTYKQSNDKKYESQNQRMRENKV